MKSWLQDAIDQIALGDFLGASPLSCGTRFGLIAVDNSVEFMLIAYVESYRQLVGGHKQGGIPKNSWQQTKRNFESLLDKVCDLDPNLRQHEDEINRFHRLRNGLYHSGTPTTVSQSRVKEYSKHARQALDVLFSISFSKSEWEEHTSNVGQALTSHSSAPTIKRSVTFDVVNDVVRFSTTDQPSAARSVALSVYGFGILAGKEPERETLLKSTAMSGYPMTNKVQNARISDLRKQGWIRKDRIQITAKGIRELKKQYLIN